MVTHMVPYNSRRIALVTGTPLPSGWPSPAMPRREHQKARRAVILAVAVVVISLGGGGGVKQRSSAKAVHTHTHTHTCSSA